MFTLRTFNFYVKLREIVIKPSFFSFLSLILHSVNSPACRFSIININIRETISLINNRLLVVFWNICKVRSPGATT
jgi:hypothetical protein